MAEKKTPKTPKKAAEVPKKSPEIEKDSGTLKELQELLEVFEKIPKDRRTLLLTRAKKEAAGEILTEDAIEAERMFTLLMGDDVDPRREYIEKHAAGVKDLDI